MQIASAQARFGAALVDGLLLAFPVAAAFYALAHFTLPPMPEIVTPEIFLTPEEVDAAAAREALQAAALARAGLGAGAFGVAWIAAYLVVCHRRWGQTLGKRLLSLRLQARAGGPPGFAAILARGALGLVRTVLWVILLALSPLFLVPAAFAPLLVALWLVIAGTVWDGTLDSPIGVAVTAACALLFGALEIAAIRRTPTLTDRLTRTVVVREGYGSG